MIKEKVTHEKGKFYWRMERDLFKLEMEDNPLLYYAKCWCIGAGAGGALKIIIYVGSEIVKGIKKR